MSTHASSDAFQPPRKEKSKSGFNNSADHLILEDSGSADVRARGAAKNLLKTKPTSIAHCRHGHADLPPNFEVVRCVEAGRAAFKKIFAISKDIVDATWGYLCASPTATRDADSFLDSVPFPKKSQPMANIWPLMDAPLLQK